MPGTFTGLLGRTSTVYGECRQLSQPCFRSHVARALDSKPSSTSARTMTVSRGSGDTIEMFVASGDDFDEDCDAGDVSKKPLRRSKSVPPPRHAVPQRLTAADRDGEAAAVQQSSGGSGQGEARLAKVELGMASAELKRTSSELERSRFALKERGREVAALRAALSERNARLKQAKGELMRLQALLQERDSGLKGVYQQLVAAAQERGDLRQQLLDSQHELADVRAELDSWTQQPQSSTENGAHGSGGGVASNGAGQPRRSRATEDNVLELLSALAQLSQQVADDASADEGALGHQ